jgi:hypothetical protein
VAVDGFPTAYDRSGPVKATGQAVAAQNGGARGRFTPDSAICASLGRIAAPRRRGPLARRIADMHPTPDSRKTLFAMSFGLAALIWLGQAAQAGPGCAPRQIVLDRLTGHFGESRQSAGLAGPHHLMELFAAPATGTWTVTVTTPDGLTCVLAAGDAWEAMPHTAAADGDPA